MAIRVTCSVSGQVIVAPDRFAGQTIRCPVCRGMHRVPMPGEADPFAGAEPAPEVVAAKEKEKQQAGSLQLFLAGISPSVRYFMAAGILLTIIAVVAILWLRRPPDTDRPVDVTPRARPPETSPAQSSSPESASRPPTLRPLDDQGKRWVMAFEKRLLSKSPAEQRDAIESLPKADEIAPHLRPALPHIAWRLILMLEKGAGRVGEAALRKLIEGGYREQVHVALVRKFEEETDPKACVRLVRVITGMKMGRAEEALVKKLSSSGHREVRHWVILALGRLGTRRAAETLKKHFSAESAAELRGLTLATLWRIDPAGAKRLAEGALGDPQPSVRAMSLRLLSIYSGGEELLPHIRKAAKSGSPVVRLAAAEALMNLRRPEAARPICRGLLRARNGNGLQGAAWGLGELLDRESLTPLRKLTGHANAEVQEEAAEAVRKIEKAAPPAPAGEPPPAPSGEPSPAP